MLTIRDLPKVFWDFVVSFLMVILRHISLTDFIALFNFTWTSHKALSSTNNTFRNTYGKVTAVPMGR